MSRVYDVYESRFRTRRGTRRVYIGSTVDSDTRESTLQIPGPKQPAFLKAGCRDFQYRVLVPNIIGKGAALATEALMAAHQWSKDPNSSRGGPWSRPFLTKKDVAELKAVAGCSTLLQLLKLPEAVGGGRLSQHLQDIKYTAEVSIFMPSSSSKGASPVARRGPLPGPRLPLATLRRVIKKRASGRSCCGHDWRQKKGLQYLAKGVASQPFVSSKWGAKGLAAKRQHQRRYKGNK